MPRTSLTFVLSSAQIRDDITHEFSLHDGVGTTADDSADSPRLVIELDAAPLVVWEVRSTVRLFDPDALEISA